MASNVPLDAPAIRGPHDTLSRVEHSRMRRRIMYGYHRTDVLNRMAIQIGSVRKEAWGEPDLTGNPALQLYSQVAVMYDRDPERVAPDELRSWMRADGLDPKMRRVQRDTLALREMAMVCDATPSAVTFHPVFPDLFDAVESPDVPGVLIRFEWYRKVDGAWVRDVWDVSDPEAPYRRVYTTGQDPVDITSDVLGERYEGAGYPWRRGGPEGVPVIPAVLYHAELAPSLFDPYTYREVFEGTLNICVLLSMYGHIIRNAAWQQKVGIDVEVSGTGVEGDGPASRAEVVTDPATMLMLQTREGGGNPQAITLASPADPEAVLRSIGMYERRILQIAGFSTPDVAKQNADIRSGYSLAVSRESIREQQAKSETTFRPADCALMALAAIVGNRFHGRSFSENPEDYRITYRGIPEAPGEETERVKAITTRRGAGLIGPIRAYQEAYPGTPRPEAVMSLAAAAVEAAELEQAIARAYAATDSPPPSTIASPERIQVATTALSALAKGEMTPDGARFLLLQAGFPPAAVDDAVGGALETRNERENEPQP